MSHAIMRSANGRRHEVGFDDAVLSVEVHASDTTVQIVIEAVDHPVSSGKRRFALLNLPKHLFVQALAEAARRHSSLKEIAKR